MYTRIPLYEYTRKKQEYTDKKFTFVKLNITYSLTF